MTHEEALALSRDLTEACISHSLHVGYYEKMFPPVQCRVDVPLPRGDGLLSAAIRELEEIGKKYGMVLQSGILDKSLTYESSLASRLSRLA